MKPYNHPRDGELAKLKGTQVRKVGKRKRNQSGWKVAAIASVAPNELDGLPEGEIRAQIESEIQATGYPYLTFEDADLHWLKQRSPNDFHAARILAAIKDLPDFIVWRPAVGGTGTHCLLLELKRKGGRVRPGQKAFADAAGGLIAKGYCEARAALDAFQKF